jgi:hypothetical protein
MCHSESRHCLYSKHHHWCIDRVPASGPHRCPLLQVIACEMLTAWGEEGLERHLCRLQVGCWGVAGWKSCGSQCDETQLACASGRLPQRRLGCSQRDNSRCAAAQSC